VIDKWKRELLLQRIRELDDAHYKYTMRAHAVGIISSANFTLAEELRKAAICAFEGDKLQECEFRCEQAEAMAVRLSG
jgi:hypothetical protein